MCRHDRNKDVMGSVGQNCSTVMLKMLETKPLLSESTAVKNGPSGLSTITAALFVSGTMAGTGVLALPGAVLHTGTKSRILFRVFYYCKFL